MGASSYRPTIGLEIHAELNTKTKMFCDSANNPEEPSPNVNVCPVCLAHPGTLPVINKEAVRHILRIGTALGGTCANYTEFDRKSYFYPDIPKGFQISQYEFPLVKGGMLGGVEITRVHLEEDTARSTHHKDKSLIDFNRAGVPLMELVTEPVIHDAKTAGDFARELQLLLRTLGVGEANLEKGEMRIEANISVSSTDDLGTKVEVKNLNSFRAVERAIEYEISRQIEMLEKGEKVTQETRGWNEDTGKTFSQRLKEGSADYRYFPEPDLPKLVISDMREWNEETLRVSLPELPWEKRERLIARGVTKESAEILVGDPLYAAVYDREIAPIEDEKVHTASVNVLLGEVRSKAPTEAALNNLRGVFKIVMGHYVAGELSSTAAKASIIGVLERGGAPEFSLQVSDEGALREAVEQVLENNETAVREYKNGKESAMNFLLGQAMKATKGVGNPEVLKGLIKAALS